MNLFIYFNPDIFLAWPANTDAGRLREFSAMEGGEGTREEGWKTEIL